MPPQLLIIYSSAEVVEGKTPLVRAGQVHGNLSVHEARSKKIIGFILTVPEPSCSSFRLDIDWLRAFKSPLPDVVGFKLGSSRQPLQINSP